MKKKIVITLSIIFAMIVGFGMLLMYFLLPAPDMAINTPPQVKQIVLQEVPEGYELESVESIRRISTFENENRPMRWLVLTLKNKTITDENELYEIAKPICLGLLSNDTGYEGMDINPNQTLLRGANCGIWGP